MAKFDIDNIQEIMDSDEPIFILRAKDACAVNTLQFYAVKCNLEGSPETHVREIRAIADFFQMWQSQNPEKVKLPD